MKKIIIPILVIVVFYLLANLSPIQRTAVNYGINYLKNEFAIEVSVKRIEGNLLHNLQLSGVKVKNIAKIENLGVSYNLLSLIFGRFRINTIEIKGLMIDVDQVIKLKPTKGKEETKAEKGGMGIDINSLILDSGLIKYQGREIPISLSLKYLNNSLEVTDLVIQLPNSKIITSGFLNSKGRVDFSYKVNLNLVDLNIGEGKILSTGRISGESANPEGTGDVTFSSIAVDKVKFDYKLENQVIYLNDLSIAGKNFSLSGKAHYNFRETLISAELHGSVAEERLSLSAYYKKPNTKIEITGATWVFSIMGTAEEKIDLSIGGSYINTPITGRIKYQAGTITGMIAAKTFKPSDEFSIEELVADFNFKFADSEKNGKAKIAVNNVRHLKNHLGDLEILLTLREDELLINTSGFLVSQGNFTLTKPNPFALSFSVADFDLSNYLTKGSGTLNISGNVAGKLSTAKGVDLSIVIEDFAAAVQKTHIMIEEPIRLAYSDSRIEIRPSKLIIDGSEIQVRGTLAKNLDFHFSTERFNLETISWLFTNQSITGQLDAEIYLAGSTADPQYKGDAEIKQFTMITGKDTIGPINLKLNLDKNLIMIYDLVAQYRNYTVSNEGPILLELAEKYVLIKESKIDVSDATIAFSGSIPIADDSIISIVAKTDSLDLKILSPLVKDVDFAGLLSTSVEIKGPISKPDIIGHAILDSIHVITEKDTIGPIVGTIDFTRGYVILNSIAIVYHEGQGIINGALGLEKRGKLFVKLDNINLSITRESNIQIGSELIFSGRIDSLNIDGEISLKGKYNEPIEQQLISGYLNQVNRPAKKPPDYLERIKLNLGLNIDFTVKNNAADLRLIGDLQLVGSTAYPGITGRMNIEEGGKIGYLGKNFTIEKGIIDLVDPRKIIPEIDIIAFTSIDYQETEYRITLSITGPPDNLQFMLTSAPELPHQEIVALIVTGETRGFTQLPSAQQVGAAAVNLLIEKFKENIEARTARALGLERITVTGPFTEPESLRLLIEKRIQRRVKLSYTTGFENWEQQKVGVDYDINRNISIYSTYDLENQDADAGFDLHLKIW